MPKLTIESLGRKLSDKRGARGIREVAKEIGVSPATLSRVERGHVPDLTVFGKICRWLKVDPAEILGIKTSPGHSSPAVAVHFRKKDAHSEDTARALANMILAAQREFDRTME